MAKVFVLPVIRREDYAAFKRAVGPSLANSYDEWATLFAREVAEARKSGKTVIEVPVEYGEFVRHCSANGMKPTPQALLDFAAHRPRGEA